jgi:hypothetical protein
VRRKAVFGKNNDIMFESGKKHLIVDFHHDRQSDNLTFIPVINLLLFGQVSFVCNRNMINAEAITTKITPTPYKYERFHDDIWQPVNTTLV